MSVTVTVTGRPLADLIPIAPQELMREIGLLAERRIRTRTEQMVDVHGVAFAPLSADYATQKADAGLSPVPNLTVSGRMLNDMTVTEVTEGRVTIGFISAGGSVPRLGRSRRGKGKRGSSAATFIQRSRAIGAADKAFWHTESGAGKSRVKRQFFALNASDEAAIVEAIEKHFDKASL